MNQFDRMETKEHTKPKGVTPKKVKKVKPPKAPKIETKGLNS